MHRRELLELLHRHRTTFMEEAAYVDRAIRFVSTHEDCFHRHNWPLHVTGSAWVVSPDRKQVLLMHHRKHDQWFQPGGHADGESDIVQVALRETLEETGLKPDQVRLVQKDLFDVDIHTIPAMGGDPRHEHIDCRFLIEANDGLIPPGNSESHQLLWVPLFQAARYNRNRSTHRMIEKTRRMR